MENWVEVSGSFVADSNYQFLSIGDFFKNDSTDILILPNQPLYNNLGSYYYVDDVYVGEDEPNEIKEANERVIAIYPNPASEFVTLDYGFTNWTKGDIELQIVNSIGQTVYGQQLPSYSAFQKIDVSHFANGVYLVTIKKLGQLIANAKFVRE
ncbi:MAG: T9SS type A sorting domain-containing protein [Chitinophagales bacterium]